MNKLKFKAPFTIVNPLRPFYGPLLEPDNISLARAYKMISSMSDPYQHESKRAKAAVALYKMLFEDPSISVRTGVMPAHIIGRLESGGRVDELHAIGAIDALERLVRQDRLPPNIRVRALHLWSDLNSQLNDTSA